METQVRIAFEKRESKYLAGSVGEEVPIRPVPSPDRIALDVDLREEHRSGDPGEVKLIVEPADVSGSQLAATVHNALVL